MMQLQLNLWLNETTQIFRYKSNQVKLGLNFSPYVPGKVGGGVKELKKKKVDLVLPNLVK